MFHFISPGTVELQVLACRQILWLLLLGLHQSHYQTLLLLVHQTNRCC
jgi:hypothetical protein